MAMRVAGDKEGEGSQAMATAATTRAMVMATTVAGDEEGNGNGSKGNGNSKEGGGPQKG